MYSTSGNRINKEVNPTCQRVCTIENLKKLTEELMREDRNFKYRNFVLSTAFSDQRPPVDTTEVRLEDLHNKPRYDPDKAMMSI